MDFLNPNRERNERRRLYFGYVLVALAIVMATLLLLYNAYGFSVNRQGQLIQSGIVFVSSQPDGSQITLNDQPYKDATNTRMELAAGVYQMKISAPGYRDWQRTISVLGGDVQHFDYPFLFPSKLQTGTVGETTTSSPQMVSQSPDRRWIIQDIADEAGQFRLIDLKNPAQPVVTTLALPATAYTVGTAQTWTATEWSSDNRHLLLQHGYGDSAASLTDEYVMLDRQDSSQSLNVTTTLNISSSVELSLFDKKPTKFYLMDTAAQTLQTASTDNSLTPRTIQHVLAFKSYSDDTLLYVTTTPPTGAKQSTGTVTVVLEQDGKTYPIRSLPAGADVYNLNLAQYSGDWYLALAASNDTGMYLYKNPQSQRDGADGYPAPLRLLTLGNINKISFSSNTQYIAAESGQQFVIYDAENVETYRYTTTQPIDQPQSYATWMDGNRLTYVSSGKVVVFDYDHRNVQTLQAAAPAYLPMFSGNYRFSFTQTINAETGASSLTSTPLTTEQ